MKEIVFQRCFSIPKGSLDLFLKHITNSSSEMGFFRADYIFVNDETYYDVVVNEYGSRYLYIENQMEKFAAELCNA